MSKKWYESKTVWFNVVALIVAVAQYFGYKDFPPDPNIGAYALTIVTLANLILRAVTSKKVTL